MSARLHIRREAKKNRRERSFTSACPPPATRLWIGQFAHRNRSQRRYAPPPCTPSTHPANGSWWSTDCWQSRKIVRKNCTVSSHVWQWKKTVPVFSPLNASLYVWVWTVWCPSSDGTYARNGKLHSKALKSWWGGETNHFTCCSVFQDALVGFFSEGKRPMNVRPTYREFRRAETNGRIFGAYGAQNGHLPCHYWNNRGTVDR